MKRLIVILALLPVAASGQSVSVSPMSHVLWGQIESIGSVSVEYKGFGVHYFHNYRQDWCCHRYGDDKIQVDGHTQSSFAVSYLPVNIKNVFRSGLLYAFRDFPATEASNVNFWLELGYSFDRFRISYVHLSNGAAILNDVNPGVDQIRITVILQ